MDRNLQFLAPLNGVNEKRLRYFYTVMMFGSMRKAADVLNIEQSAMSRQIQQFEAELKTTLFKRKGRHIVPTEAAYLVLEYFKENKLRENVLFENLFQLQSSHLGKVNLVSSESYMQQLIYDVLRHVHREYPKLEIQLELMSVNHVVRHIVDGLAHMGLAYNPPFHAEITTIAHKVEPFILAVPAEHPLASLKRPVCLSEAAEYTFALMPVGHGFRQLLDSEMVRLQTHLNIGLTTNSIYALKNYVVAGHGISAMRFADIADAVEQGLAVALTLDSELCNSAQTQLMVRKNTQLSESNHLLIEQIRASFDLNLHETYFYADQK